MSGTAARLPRSDRETVRPPDPKGNYRATVRPIKHLTNMGMGPEQILADEGWKRDPDTVEKDDDGNTVKFEMVLTPEQFAQQQDLANRRADAADAPRLPAGRIRSSETRERELASADDARAFMGDEGLDDASAFIEGG